MFIELCPHCMTEQAFNDSQGLVVQTCNCGEILLPCAMCKDMHITYAQLHKVTVNVPCSNCPFDYDKVHPKQRHSAAIQNMANEVKALFHKYLNNAPKGKIK